YSNLLKREVVIIEKWKDIKGYEDSYEVSNLGRVRSKERTRKFGRATKTFESKILKQSEDKDGYYRVNLSKDGKKKRFFAHRLVATAFIETNDDKPVINHMDGNKKNNVVDNLEWCTRSENDLHAFDVGLRKPTDGGTSRTVLMVDSQTNQVVKKRTSMSEASRETGHSVGRVSYSENNKPASNGDGIRRFE